MHGRLIMNSIDRLSTHIPASSVVRGSSLLRSLLCFSTSRTDKRRGEWRTSIDPGLSPWLRIMTHGVKCDVHGKGFCLEEYCGRGQFLTPSMATAASKAHCLPYRGIHKTKRPPSVCDSWRFLAGIPSPGVSLSSPSSSLFLRWLPLLHHLLNPKRKRTNHDACMPSSASTLGLAFMGSQQQP